MNNGKYTERLLAKIAAVQGLSEDGIEWLRTVLDPFPDGKESLTGYPDENESKSVVMKVRQGLDISLPASITSGNVDVLIFFSGNLRRFQTADNSGTGAVRLDGDEISFEGSSDAGMYPVSPLTVLVRPTGSEMFPDQHSYPWLEVNADRFFGLDFEAFMNDRCRFLGGAIECTDTTPEFYKGGSISTADVTSTFERTQSLINFEDQGSAPNWRMTLGTDLHNAPPGTLAEITLLPGAQTREMKTGCYAVLRQSKLVNPYKPTAYVTPIWATSYPYNASQTTYGVGNEPTLFGQISVFNGISCQTTFAEQPPSQPVPFDIKAILCSNLDPHFSLRVNFNAVIEAIPDLDDQRLLVMAHPSPSLDMRALELYSAVVRELPASVPVADNASGKWWDTVLGVLSKYAEPIGQTLGNLGVPMAGMIGTGISKAAGMGKQVLDAKQAKKAQKAIAAPPQPAKVAKKK
jgi:hypothetical protein